MNGNMDISVLLDEFLEDAAGHLDGVETTLMELERQTSKGCYDAALLTNFLGNLHTLKGNSGMMGFSTLQAFIHHMESVIKQASDDRLPLTHTFFEICLTAVSAMRGALRQLADDPAACLTFDDETMLLDSLLMGQEENAVFMPEQKADDGYVTAQSNTLKVNFAKLDELLNMAGELVIQKTALLALETRLRESVNDKELLAAFSETGQMIGKISAELREAIMKARMLPVRTVFQRFNRLVRDLSVLHDKEICLRFEGEETELDKTVIDELGEPLLHLIRNAVDHGIEPSRERQMRGKTPIASLTLRARHESNNIVISVVDDGRGISPDKLKNSALAQGLIDDEQARDMSDQEALELIFLPGFSTSREVTETSGRGIGLDVVKKTVNALNGMIGIESVPDVGTEFTIILPLTLAIIAALLVEVSGEIYALPLAAVLESVRIYGAEIHQVGGGEMIKLRDRLLPVSRLDRFFRLSKRTTVDAEYVVVVGSGEKRGGLIVDRLIGQQEIVIKAMDDYLGVLPGIAGGTVLGDGKIALILDVAALIGYRQ